MSGPLVVSLHPLQAAGAWAVAVLAGRAHPSEVTDADVDAVADRLAVWYGAAGSVGKDEAGYGLWKVLFNLFPNSPVTHNSRPRDAGELAARVADDVFGPDSDDAGWVDVLDGRPAGVSWGKDRFPMVDSVRLVNLRPTLDVEGWPVRRANRVALWALPFGCVNHPARSWVVSTRDEAAAAAWFGSVVATNVATFVDGGAVTVPPITAWAELEVLRIVGSLPREVRRAGATVFGFKNENQAQPALVVASVSAAGLEFYRGLDPAARAGWDALVEGAGTAKTPGRVRVAQALFESTEPGRPSFVEFARRQLRSGLVEGAAEVAALICRHYREVEGMEAAVTEACEHVAVGVAGWVKDRSSRARYQKTHRALGRLGDFDALIRTISHERVTTARHLPSIDPDVYRRFRHHPKAWDLLTVIHLHVSALVGDLTGEPDPDPDSGLDDEVDSDTLEGAL